jgi:hypothetical protein
MKEYFILKSQYRNWTGHKRGDVYVVTEFGCKKLFKEGDCMSFYDLKWFRKSHFYEQIFPDAATLLKWRLTL